MRCERAGCAGEIVDGYCDRCGFAPRHTAPARPAPARPAPAHSAPAHSAPAPRPTTGRTFPHVEMHDPRLTVLADPDANDHPPTLHPGDLVGGQYEIAGCLARGGLGWVYLAQDRRVDDRWVALKGLLDTGDDEALAVALAERRFLAQVEHPNIVRIHNFVEHEHHGYIVMEHVNGESLQAVLEQRRRELHDDHAALPAVQAIACILEMLPAIGHLHQLGLAYCDFKPSNVIVTDRTVKLIDLGGVYRLDEQTAAMYGTRGYQAPEIAVTGPTVASDLHTVGRTLAVLAGVSSTPDPAAGGLDGPDSLHRLVQRAAAPDPGDRFASADEMAAQLEGVQREVVAMTEGRRLPGSSALFTGEAHPGVHGPDWTALPLLLVPPDDPAAGYLATVRGRGAQRLEALEAAPTSSLHLDLQLALALVASRRGGDAERLLAVHEVATPSEWRVIWTSAVVAMADGRLERARTLLRDLDRMLPGELAPKAAAAMAAEADGDHAAAARWYEVVAATDPSMTTAAFGLARCRLALGDRRGAVGALAGVPETASSHVDAQVASVRTTLGEPDGMVTLRDLLDAAEVAERIPADHPARAAIEVEVHERALAHLRDHPGDAAPGQRLLGVPLTERGLRIGLEVGYRALARQAPDRAARIELVDRANAVRPRTWI